MNRATQLRSAIESSLAQRIPAALTPQMKTASPVLSTGIAELDALLGGGLPLGGITEIVGPPSSGRTSCAQSFVARVLAEGKVGAWIDTSDALDPQSAAANGIDLSRLLWVRCSGSEGQPGSSEGLRPGRPVSAQEPAAARPQFQGGSGSGHPRNEVHGIPEALDTLFSDAPVSGSSDMPRSTARRSRNVGTPGMPNRDLFGGATGQSSFRREEQVSSDRMPARRGDYLLARRARHSVAAIPPKRSERAAERSLGQNANSVETSGLSSGSGQTHWPARFQAPNRPSPWRRLDQGLRTMDLVLQGGGFGIVVFDLADMTPEIVNRIPMATWFRFRAAAERTCASVLLLTQHLCTQSSAEVVLRTRSVRPAYPGTVLSELPCTVELVRQRFLPDQPGSLPPRKPPQQARTTSWMVRTPWSGGR